MSGGVGGRGLVTPSYPIIFTGHDWVQVDLYAVYMLVGYFAVTWLGIGARRVYHNAMEGTEKKK